MFHQIKHRGLLYRIWYYVERRIKELMFDCHMCGQCVVRSTALTCPMQCPKQMRNGPCGGSMDGQCEVFPERRCIWTQIHRRSRRFEWMRRKLAGIQPAIDWSLFGSSAWLNIWPEKKIALGGHAFTPAPVPSGNIWDRPDAGAPAPTADGSAAQSNPEAGR
ncbi:MAG: methylenetetrahydrofolate reductase C-terminal domain-containing protein [bacterium]|nr:methylenetetrahydrofolate reductase C-terminal domain-containing protein [bacterium]